MSSNDTNRPGEFGAKNVVQMVYMAFGLLVITFLHRTILGGFFGTLIYWLVVVVVLIGFAINIAWFFMQCFYPDKLSDIRIWVKNRIGRAE